MGQLKKLGHNIANIRIQKNMSQYKLAKEILTSQRNLDLIEKGIINPSYKTLLKISGGLSCEVKDLVDV